MTDEQRAVLDLAVLNLKTHGDDQLLTAIKPLLEFYESRRAAGASEWQEELWARADYPVLWTRHGSGENAWYSRDGYEARKNAAGRWVLSRAGLPIFEHEYLQEVTARAFVLTHDLSAEIAALRERIAGMEKDAERWRIAREFEYVTDFEVLGIDQRIDAGFAKEPK
jgi:hypothetical protein